MSILTVWYQKIVLQKPVPTLMVCAVLFAFFLAHVTAFELDASADSLILENDSSLQYYRSVRAKYGSDDFLILTYSPKTALFGDQSLADIGVLRDQLKAIENVSSVVSILDVPLVSSPPMTLSEISRGIRTLESSDTQIDLARQEFVTSPLYKNLLVSADGTTTAFQINLARDEKRGQLTAERDRLYLLQTSQALNANQLSRLEQLKAEIKLLNQIKKLQQESIIHQVRAIMDQHRSVATLYLGGVPMIVADSIDFIRSDLKVFGAGVIGFIVIILFLSFRSLRWVLLPLAACLTSALTMIGFLGWMAWPVTVVSSNFVSLLLIITLSLIIHLIVRYRELTQLHADYSQFQLVSETLKSKFIPCVYTSITTMVAFGSLLVSGIRPVIDFGWMMVIGIMISFVIAFTLFPAALMLMPRLDHQAGKDVSGRITGAIAELIHRRGKATLVFFIALGVIGLAGLPQLSVENRFIDYYKADTEIYQGMSLIDDKLGGTTPMDIIIDAPGSNAAAGQDTSWIDIEDITSTSYWFNSDGLQEVAAIQAYLESLPEVGKVLSLDSGMRMLQELNDGEPYSDFKLAVVYKRLPDNVKTSLIEPYLSPDGNQLRFSIRIYESNKSLKRQELLDTIRHHLVQEMGLKPEQVTISGMAVLYNNMLQSLFKSQILTIGAVFIAILLMFIFLFRAVKISLAALIPNILAAGLILGLMGWIGIPLDIMTITISAISIGIGVDNSIHYIHRFRSEFAIDGDYWGAIKRCHDSIARALYYTTVTVVLGFSILALSNFIPTIYFGLLSGLAMMTALVANLMLLPILIARYELK